MLVRAEGILGSAGRSDFVVWMMLSILLVEAVSQTQIREQTAEESGGVSGTFIFLTKRLLEQFLATALLLAFIYLP